MGIRLKFHIPSYSIIFHLLHSSTNSTSKGMFCAVVAFGLDANSEQTPFDRFKTRASGVFEGLSSATLQIWLQHPLHNGNLGFKIDLGSAAP